MVGLVTVTFAVLEAGRGLGDVGADTLVVNGPQGADVLPPLYVALGVAGMVLTVAYTAALAGARGERFFPVLLLVVAAALLGAWAIAQTGGQEAVSLLWVVVSAASALLFTVSWTVAGRVFHARQARRLFPLCASAAIAGSFTGQLAAGPLAHAMGVAQLVLLEALLLSVAAVVTLRIGRPLRTTTLGTGPMRRALREGAEQVAASPLLRLIAVVYVVFAVLLVSVSFTFLGQVTAAFPDEAERATALGLFSATVTAVAFLVSALVASRVTARFGVSATALSLPLVYLVGFLLWAVQLSLVTAATVRFAQVVTQRGISNASWTSFFSVVPAHRRAQVMAFIDGIPGQMGTILTGLFLMAGVVLGRELFVGAAVVAAVCLGVVMAIRRAYVDSLVATLRDGVVVRVLDRGADLGAIVADPQVLDELLVGIDAPDPTRRRITAGLLGIARTPRAAAALAVLARDPDPAVRAAAITGLASVGAGVETALAALEDARSEVRVAALALLSAHPAAVAGLAPDAVAQLAADPDARVRGAMAVAAAGTPYEPVAVAVTMTLLEGDVAARSAGAEVLMHRPALLSDAHHRLRALMDDPHDPVRRSAARALGATGDGGSALVTVVVEGTPAARDAALAAVPEAGDLAPAARDRLLAWGDEVLDRARWLRTQATAVSALGADPPPAGSDAAPSPSDALHGLASVLRTRERDAVECLLLLIGALCPPDAGLAIRRSLRSGSAETRAQATEALEVVAGGSFARRVAALLDDAPAPAARRSTAAVVGPISADRDPWLRAFALRTLSALPGAAAAIDRTAADRGSLTGAVLDDPITRRLAHMSDGTPATLDLIERMVLLGRVPLFATLSPEDLSTIAATATEAAYAADERVIAEGDDSDHLVIIVRGSVRVVTSSAGEERVVRRCGPGEHIGELAMLRRAPRAASVLADEPGVRALLLDADGLRSVLRERPDAAMAMLSTLADRIGRQ